MMQLKHVIALVCEFFSCCRTVLLKKFQNMSAYRRGLSSRFGSHQDKLDYHLMTELFLDQQRRIVDYYCHPVAELRTRCQ